MPLPAPNVDVEAVMQPPPRSSGPTLTFSRWLRNLASTEVKSPWEPGYVPATSAGSAADRKAVAEYASHATVLGASAGATLAESGTVGSKQLATEERFVLQPGVIHPFNRWYRCWWWLTIAAAAVTGWLVPYTIAFLSGHDGPGSAAYGLEAALLAIFLVDMGSSFFVARYERGVLIGDRRALVLLYLRFRFWWDCLTVLPWDWIVLSALGLLGSEDPKARFVSLLGVLKLGRLYRLDRLYRHLEFSLAMPLAVTKLTRIITYAFYLTHWAACGFWFIAMQEEALGASSWVTAISAEDKMMGGSGLSPREWILWEQYTFSVWWSVSTFFPVGAGHGLAPVTLAEVVFTMCYLALCVLLWGFVLGSITLLVARSDETSAKYRHRMHALDRYGRDKGLPAELKELIEGHLRLNFMTNQDSDEAMLASLPTTLRRRVLRHLYGDHLRRCWLLAGVKPKFFDALLGVARLETIMPQVEVFTEGDEVNELSFVVGGYLEVFASSAAAEAKDRESLLDAARYSRLGGEQKLLTDMSVGKRSGGVGTSYNMLGPGDVVGEVSFFTEIPQLELVRSLTVCRLLIIPRPAWGALAADFPLSATAVLEALQKNAERLVSAEFRGGAATRLLRGSLVQTLPGLSYQHTSAETAGEAAAAEAAARAAAAAKGEDTSGLSGKDAVGGLTVRQQQVVGSLQRIRALVKHHVAQADESRTGQFLSAAAKGQYDRVKLLLQQGFSANACDYSRRTALMLASAGGHTSVVEMLLAVNAQLNAKDKQGHTALLEACLANQPGIMALLLARGAKLGQDTLSQAQLLCGAITRGDMSGLVNLLKAGADANAADYDLRVPLHIAAIQGNVQAAKTLVEVGKARLDVKSRSGFTPLDLALNTAATQVAEYLADQMPDAEVEAARRHAAARRAEVMLQAAADGDMAAIKKLLERGCPPDAADYDRRTGLMLAAANGHRAVLSLLLAAGANPNARDNLGGSPLLEAVKGGREDVLRLLVAAGASLQLSASELSSALCSMVSEDEAALLAAYIAAGADVNAADYDARTALMIAAAEGKLSMVKLLVEVGGADLAAKDRWGATALAEAQRVGAADVVAYLKSPAAATAAAAARAAAAERKAASARFRAVEPASVAASSSGSSSSAPQQAVTPLQAATAAPAGGGDTAIERAIAQQQARK